MRKIILTLMFLVCCFQQVEAQPNNRNSKREQQQAASEPSPVPTASPQDKINDEAEAAREAYRKERDTKDDAFRADQSRQNEIIANASARMVWITAVNVFIAAVYGVFAYLTLRAVKRQADHASDQVEKMEATLEAMDKEQNILQGQLDAMKEQVRYSEAAYITVDIAKMVKKVIVGQRSQAIIVFRNSGNTPAYDLHTYGHMDLKPRGFIFSHDEARDIRGTAVSQTIIGGHGQTTTQDLKSGVASKELIQEIKANELMVYVWGITTYTDIFQRERWTTFCLVQMGDSELFEVAPNGNEADQQ